MSKSLTKEQEGIWGMAAHMSALIGVLFAPGIVVGPLIVWLMKRNDSEFIDTNAKEALNFQLTVLAATFILAMLSAISGIFLILAMAVGIAGLGFAIFGGLQAKKGINYVYPFAIRLIK